VQLWSAEAQLHPETSPERAEIGHDIATAQKAAELAESRAGHLRVIDDLRQQWSASVEHQRLAYEKAGDELARRGLDRDPAQPEIDQLGLFEIIVSTAATAADRQIAQGQLQLDLPEANESDPVTVTRTASQTETERPSEQLTGQHTTEADPDQATLFVAEPASSDLAAAQPLRTIENGTTSREVDPLTRQTEIDEQASPTISEARRQAEISAELRAGRDLRSHTTTWEHDLTDNEAEAQVARTRRNNDPGLNLGIDDSLTLEQDSQSRSIRRGISFS
jgi:hypothetical protein